MSFNTPNRSLRPTLIINVGLVLLSTILTFVFLEGACWIWTKYYRTNHLPQWEFRATQPAPYQGANYFSAKFLKESEESIRGRLFDVLELEDYEGKYFNVRKGYRVTTNLPDKSMGRILLFGGSTLFGQEVPDEFTVASHLQRLINRAGLGWEVLNFGLHGMNAKQQTKILMRQAVNTNDIVIFYHGVNDVYYVIFGGYVDGWRMGVPGFRPIQKLNPIHKFFLSWHKRLKDYSFSADVALDIYDRGQPNTVTDKHLLKATLGLAARDFSKTIEEAALHVEKKVGRFVHFLQPQIFEVRELSNYEKSLVANPLLIPPGLGIAFKQGYPRFREVADDLRETGIQYYDISGVFNERVSNSEVLLDFCHVNHYGNELIAKGIFSSYRAELFKNQE